MGNGTNELPLLLACDTHRRQLLKSQAAAASQPDAPWLNPLATAGASKEAPAF